MMERNSKGFTLLGTVFILVILSLAGVYLLKMGTTRTMTLNYQLLSKRAELAAFSALEIATHKYQENPQECPKQTLQFNEVAVGLKGFTAAVSCSQMLVFPQQAPRYYAVQLMAKASKGQFGDRDFVSHTQSRLLFIEQ